MRDLTGFAVECDALIHTTPDRLWALVTDIALPARFSPELQSVAWLDGAAPEPVPGARFTGLNRNPRIGEWRTTCQVVESREPRYFGWAVLDFEGPFVKRGAPTGEPLVIWHFDLAPEGSAVRLRHGMRLTGGYSGLHAAVAAAPERTEEIVRWRAASLREGIAQTLAGVKALAEPAPAR
ncbi:hypothetical protein GCM10010124_11050 [Pilimelia terevasa]|uniref:SRPBCC family protein n=1 Tax=Pilimelia terevasa TaxID=53372 RepID=A0A8J3BGT5_9ACTN|nr:SRPBCC family protein [Pilimelia terevasa]GGK20208.1 hypothetical protein GCM10010124_11050 [Pilimelia terevasa]